MKPPYAAALVILGSLLATSPAMGFTAAQLKTARVAYCQAEREQVAQGAADIENNQSAGDPTTLMIATMMRAKDRLQAKLNLSENDAFQLVGAMLKRYPDLGNAHSGLEVLSACKDSGD